MKLRSVLIGIALTIGISISASAANYVYVGSWEVDQGPNWNENPLAYSGLDAAALLFGGNASDYAISTRGSALADINHEAWYSIIGVGGGTAFAENYMAPNTVHYQDVWNGWDANNSASAYVWDNAQGAAYTNYAFRIAAVPEPETLAMMIAGLGLLGAVARRKKQD